LLFGVVAAQAQPVTAIGPVTVGHCAAFNSPTVIKDAGAGCSSGWTNIRHPQTSAYAAVSSDCGATLALGGGAFYTLTVNAASGYTATCILVVLNEDTGRAKNVSVNGVGQFYLWPQQTAVIYNDNNVWQISRPMRWSLNATTTFNVSPTGNDSNDCLGTGSGACLTIQGAINIVCAFIDAATQRVNIAVADGTYGAINLCPVVGAAVGSGQAGPNPHITGNVATPANCTISTANAAAIHAAGPMNDWFIEGFTLTASGGGGIDIQVDATAWVRFGVLTLGNAGSTVAVQALNNGVIEFMGNLSVTGTGLAIFAYSYLRAYILFSAINITLVSTPSINVFAESRLGATQTWQGVTFTGTFTGTRFIADTGGGIDTGGGANFFPGTVAGSATNPGWYD